MLHFSGVKGDAAELKEIRVPGGRAILLNGKEIPAVMDYKVVFGNAIPKVVMEVAICSYESEINRISLG